MEAKEANAVGPGIKASVGFNDFLDLEVANPIICLLYTSCLKPLSACL